jgi:hypothetical protein
MQTVCVPQRKCSNVFFGNWVEDLKVTTHQLHRSRWISAVMEPPSMIEHYPVDVSPFGLFYTFCCKRFSAYSANIALCRVGGR